MKIEFDKDRFTNEQILMYYDMRKHFQAEDVWMIAREDEEEYSDLTQEEFEEACSLYSKWRDEGDGWTEDVRCALDLARENSRKA